MTNTRLLQGEITDNLIIEKRGAVGWITFNDPAKHNAMSYDMWASLPKVIKIFEEDDDIRAVVLTGAGGKSFVSGANISQFEKLRSAADAVAEYERVGEEAQASIYNCAKPVIARIDGYCIGGGLNLSLCCDIRIASDASSFGIPAGRLGLGYRLTAIRNLVSTIGAPEALDIMLSAARFKAQDAKAKGLIQYLVPVAELDKAVDEYWLKSWRTHRSPCEQVKKPFVSSRKSLRTWTSKASSRWSWHVSPATTTKKASAPLLKNVHLCFAANNLMGVS